MAKAFGTLMFRGIMGIISIAATAVITVLVQRYLYEKTGTPPILAVPSTPSSASPTAQPEAESQQIKHPGSPLDSTEAELGEAEPGVSSELESKEKPDERPTRIMEQFWDKLNQ